MLTEDYLIRMINLAIAALLRIIGLKQSGSYEEALQLIDLVFEQLLGLRASMAKNLDDDRLYFLLTSHDRLDTQRLEIIGELFIEEGDIYTAQNRLAEAREDYTRALRYSLEVFFDHSSQDEAGLAQKIDALAQFLSIPGMGASTLWPLAGYYEEKGAYALAEAALLELENRPDLQASIRPELAAFYQRLLEKPKPDLAKGGIALARVQEQLARLRQQK